MVILVRARLLIGARVLVGIPAYRVDITGGQRVNLHRLVVLFDAKVQLRDEGDDENVQAGDGTEDDEGVEGEGTED